MLRGHASGDYIAGDTGQDMIRDLRGHNRIVCGQGFDRVLTNQQSVVSASCESVRRR